jgi:hypothetical protein
MTVYVSAAEKAAMERVEELDAALDDLAERGAAIQAEIAVCLAEFDVAMARLEELRRG